MRDKVSQMHADLCKTLGNPVTIEILKSLGEGEKTVGEVCRTLGLRQANVSQHLALLRQRQMVVTRREGTNVFYRLSDPKIIQACNLMREVLIGQLREAQKLSVTAKKSRR